MSKIDQETNPNVKYCKEVAKAMKALFPKTKHQRNLNSAAVLLGYNDYKDLLTINREKDKNE